MTLQITKRSKLDMDQLLPRHVHGFLHMLGAGGKIDDHHKVQYFNEEYEKFVSEDVFRICWYDKDHYQLSYHCFERPWCCLKEKIMFLAS